MLSDVWARFPVSCQEALSWLQETGWLAMEAY
jgi:hypothetical protein